MADARLQSIQSGLAAAGAAATAAEGDGTSEPAWLEEVRGLLPLTRTLTYFQTGGHGPALDSALEATAASAADDAHVGMEIMTGVRPQFFKAAGLGSGTTGVAAAAARTSIGELLGCSADSVAVMGSTTHALYTVIMARQWAAGDELIISNLEHVCIASAAQGLESQYGVVIKAVAADRGDDTFVAELERALSPRTRLVAFS